MSTFTCPLVKVAEVTNHPNADRLSLVQLEGLSYVCISGKLEDGSPRYKAGDWVVYIPSAAVLPETLLREMDFWNEETNKGTLAGADGNRVKPLRLRGIFSEGVLYPATVTEETDGLPGDQDHFVKYWKICAGETGSIVMRIYHSDNTPISVSRYDMSSVLGITKYEPPIPTHMAGEVASVSEAAFKYDFERIESVPDIFLENELVVATEKLHGTCMIIQLIPGLNHPEMFGTSGCITVSSKGLGAQGLVMKNNDTNSKNIYVRTLKRLLEEYDLEETLRHMSQAGNGARVFLGGEIFGKGVQDLDYGTSQPEFRVFDAKIGHDWVAPSNLGSWDVKPIPQVPVLYRGAFDVKLLEEYRDGTTTVGGTNVREGIVVHSMVPGEHPIHGRKIAKLISPNYLLRKVKNGEATEYT